jgi:diketogulonate reductase-like aldo/keto reductase
MEATLMDIKTTIRLRSGNSMPVLGLGTWELNNDTAETIAAALKMGYKMIDTSGDYGTQPGIGEGIRKSGIPRNEFYLVTKVEQDEDSYQATQKDLEELRLDYTDMMLIHRPPQSGVGEDLWQGLIKAKKDGLTRDIGVSNYSVDQLKGLMDASGEVPVVNQIEWSPFGYSPQMLDFCRQNKIVIQAYSPLTRAERLDDDDLQELADKRGTTPALVLLRWAIQMGVAPIVKANRDEHLQQNLKVFDFELDDEDMEVLAGFNEEYSSLSSKPVYMKG